MSALAFTADRPARVAILISGRGSNMIRLLDVCSEAGSAARVVRVLSDKAEAPGLASARERGVETAVVDQRGKDAREAAIDAALRADEADIVCLAGFMRILSGAFVEQWRDRILNIHPSLLPSFRGLDTHERAIAAGVKLHGATVHIVRPELDDGPILAQAALKVHADDTATSLAARVLTLEHRIYPEALLRFVQGDLRLAGDRVIAATHCGTTSETKTTDFVSFG